MQSQSCGKVPVVSLKIRIINKSHGIFGIGLYLRGTPRNSMRKIPRNSWKKVHEIPEGIPVQHDFVQRHIYEHEHVNVQIVTCT